MQQCTFHCYLIRVKYVFGTGKAENRNQGLSDVIQEYAFSTYKAIQPAKLLIYLMCVGQI